MYLAMVTFLHRMKLTCKTKSEHLYTFCTLQEILMQIFYDYPRYHYSITLHEPLTFQLRPWCPVNMLQLCIAQNTCTIISEQFVVLYITKIFFLYSNHISNVFTGLHQAYFKTYLNICTTYFILVLIQQFSIVQKQ